MVEMNEFKIDVSKRFQVGVVRREVCQFAKKLGFIEKDIVSLRMKKVKVSKY